jgi:phage baseplate assembly protein W
MAIDANDARLLDSISYDLVLGEFPRSRDRAAINAVANGSPPYSQQEVEENSISVNVNNLAMTRLLHDGRAQFTNAFTKPGYFFRMTTDMGPRSKRTEYGAILTKLINQKLKRSIGYFEVMRSKFAQLVLHGISPAVWETEDKWCPRAIGVEDLLVPSQTLVGFENLPFFALRRSFTGLELQKLTREDHRDPGWNMEAVDAALRWVDSQATNLMQGNWPEVWAPEKSEERLKQDSGFYASDQVPTIDCFDFYIYDDSEGQEGWIRRIILDAWGTPSLTGGKPAVSRHADKSDWLSDKDDFLFNSGSRKVGTSWQNIVSLQYADLSAVAPFRYHSVRSLGWLLYAPCHLGNRLHCKLKEAVFETLNQMYRVKTQEDYQRALKMTLANISIIDESINPVPAAERWHPNHQLVQMGLQENQQALSENGAMFQNQANQPSQKEKTATQVMAETNTSNALVGAAFAQAYEYQKFEYFEIVRRLLKLNSSDVDAKSVRGAAIQRGVPSKLLIPEAWECEPERVMGAGNKTLEMQIAATLMEWRDKFDPDGQRKILRDSVTAITDDSARAEALVPETPIVSSSVHDAQLAAGPLMMGMPMALKQGVNHQEYALALIGALNFQIQKVMKKGGVANPDELAGMQNLAGQTIAGQPIPGNGASAHLVILAADDQAKPEAKKLAQKLSKAMNEVRAMAQRLQEMQQKQQQAQAQNGQGGMDPKDQAKIQATIATGKAKIDLAKQSHAQKTAQRQIQFEQKLKQDSQKHGMEVQQGAREHQAAIAGQDLETAANIQRNQLTSLAEEEEPNAESN